MNIELKYRATYYGPSTFSRDPVIVVGMTVAPELLDDAPRIVADLAALSSPWFNGWAGTGSDLLGANQLAGALVQWALAALNFMRGSLHTAGVQATDGGQGGQTLWLGFHEPDLSLATLQLGGRLLQTLSRGPITPEKFESELAPVWRACREIHPDFLARILIEAARAMHVPHSPAWGQSRHWHFGHGVNSRVLFLSGSAENEVFGAPIYASREVSKAALAALGLPSPAHALVLDESELAAAVAQVGFPCATKPLQQGGAKGVRAGHQTLEELRLGFLEARAEGRNAVMVEAFVPGNDYRLMVMDGVLRAAIRRDVACVVGDGFSTVRQLVEIENSMRETQRFFGGGHLRRIPLDDEARQCLVTQGLVLDSVVSAGLEVRLRNNANFSTGGQSADVTPSVHPHVRTMAESLARTLNLPVLEADYLCADLSRAPREVGGAFVGFNTTLGLSALMVAGWSVEDVGRLVLGPKVGRIALDLMLVPDDELRVVADVMAGLAWLPTQGWASSERASDAGGRCAAS